MVLLYTFIPWRRRKKILENCQFSCVRFVSVLFWFWFFSMSYVLLETWIEWRPIGYACCLCLCLCLCLYCCLDTYKVFEKDEKSFFTCKISNWGIETGNYHSSSLTKDISWVQRIPHCFLHIFFMAMAIYCPGQINTRMSVCEGDEGRFDGTHGYCE